MGMVALVVEKASSHEAPGQGDESRGMRDRAGGRRKPFLAPFLTGTTDLAVLGHL